MAEISRKGVILSISEIPSSRRMVAPAKETLIGRKETADKVSQALDPAVFIWHHPKVVPLGMDAEDEWKELSEHTIE